MVNPVDFFTHSAPLVFAHRGGRALGPENTLAALDIGLEAGADGLEFDLRLSRDGVPVVIHDATLDRTTSATGLVRDHTAAELARVDAAYHFHSAGQHPWRGQGVGICTLAEVLRRYPDRRLIVEMKDNLTELGEAVAAVLRKDSALGRICAAGFGALSVKAVRRALPEVATSAHMSEVRAALYGSWVGWRVRGRGYGGYQVPEARGGFRVVSPRFVRLAHRAGHKVQVWTVDEADDIARLLAWGVDAIITDRPDAARRAVGDPG